jgi:WD40 repeat protein/Tfp pilus assembly protein PilF
VLVSVSGVAAAVLAAVVVLAVGNVRISEEKQRKDVALQQRSAALEAAQESHRDAQEQLFKALLNQARAGRFSRQMGQRMDSLDALAKAAVLHSDERLRDEAIAALALPDIRLGPTWQALPPGWTNPTFDGAYRLLARCNAEGVLSVRTVPADEEVRRIPSSPTTAWLALSPDGRFLAKGDEGGTLRVWRVSDGQPVLHDAPLSVSGIAFSPDGRHLAALQGVWGLRLDLATGRETNRWRLPQTGSDLAFHPDGRKLAVAWSGSNTGVTVFDSETGKIIADLAVGSIGEPHLAWHPDGERLAVGGTDARIQLWDVDARRRLATLEGHGQNITQVRLHPDGDLLASDSWDAVMRLWDPATGRPLMQVPFTTVKLRFSSDGRWLGVAWHGEQAQLLEVVPSREYRTLPCSLGAGQGGFYGGDISPDGRLLALGMEDGVRLWDLSSGRELARLPVARAWSALFRPDGRELLTSGPAGLYRWPIQEGGAAAPEVRLGPRRPIALPGSPDRVARSHDGRTLAVVIEGGGVALLVDSATGAVRGPQFSHPSITWVALSPEGKWVATSGWHSNRVRLWDADTGKMVHEWVLGTRATVYFTPDGRALIIGRDDEFSFWDVETRQPLRTLRRDAPQWPGNIAFSSDGKLMALEMAPGILHLKDVATGRTVSRLADPHGDRTVWLAFTPDGTRLVTVAGYAKAVHVWDLRAIRARLKEIDLDWEWPAFSAAEDGDTCPPRYSAPKPRVVVADPKGHLSLGNALSAKGQLAEAVVEYSKATELDPKYAYAHFCLGQALYGKGQLDKAIAEYQEAIHLKPNYGCAFSKLGLALHGKGLVDEAIAACKEGVRLGPAEHVDHHINLGMVLTRKGLTGEAIACYRRAIEVAPKNARILNDLSWLLATCSDARFRDPVRAVELAKNAVAMRREDGTIWKTLGAAHYRAGNWKEAVAALEKSMELRQGGNSYDWFFLAMAHWQLGERKTPRDWYDKAVKWMDQNQPKNEELRLFRAEAAGLLKIEPKKK